MRSRSTNLDAPLPKLRSNLVHRPGDGTSLREAGVSNRPKIFCFFSSEAAAPSADLAFSATNAVPSIHIRLEDDGKFPCQRNLGFVHPGSLRELCRPALQCRAFHWSRQNNETKIAPRSFRIADGASDRSVTVSMVVSRVCGCNLTLPGAPIAIHLRHRIFDDVWSRRTPDSVVFDTIILEDDHLGSNWSAHYPI
jgi:hypothetical protein